MASEFKHTLAYVRKYANSVEQEIETRLFNLGKVASGELYDSIGYDIKENRSRISLTFRMADYGRWVDKGSRPSKYADADGKGTGKSEFITRLMKWCTIKGLPKGAAFPIRRKIWKYGQPPTNFFTIPTTRRRKQFENGIEKAHALDVEELMVKDLEAAGRVTMRGPAKVIKLKVTTNGATTNTNLR